MIYITGDTHSNFRRFSKSYFPEQNEMSKEDYCIIAGDFGGASSHDIKDGGLDGDDPEWKKKLDYLIGKESIYIESKASHGGKKSYRHQRKCSMD